MNESYITAKTSIKDVEKYVIDINEKVFLSLFKILKIKNELIFTIDDNPFIGLVVRKNEVRSRLYNNLGVNEFSFFLEGKLMSNIAKAMNLDSFESDAIGSCKISEYENIYDDRLAKKNWFIRTFCDPRRIFKHEISEEHYETLKKI